MRSRRSCSSSEDFAAGRVAPCAVAEREWHLTRVFLRSISPFVTRTNNSGLDVDLLKLGLTDEIYKQVCKVIDSMNGNTAQLRCAHSCYPP